MFKLQNLVYLGIWIFNIFTYVLAKRMDDLYSDNVNVSYKYKDMIAGILKIIPILMMVCSIVLSIITMHLSDETTNKIMGIYTIVSFADLMITGIIGSIYERRC